MDPWYKVVEPREEVRQGRSFNPDEFAIHLEQVVNGKAPEDYREPNKFFSRTCFTLALRENVELVLRRLSGETANSAPVLTLITQFGGGKTHTLATLFHLARNPQQSAADPGVANLLREAEIKSLPETRVAVFVGNAWDPTDTRETPWIDIARQLAGDEGVAALGPSAKTTAPGTEALSRVYEKAGGTVLILFDEVLNFLNRHRAYAESFHAFIQNITVSMTGTTRSACVISLPRSQVEMTEWDQTWQDRITKVVKRVAKDVIVNDEAEISEVVRRRLFDSLGKEATRKKIAMEYADWCFERRAQLPQEWTAVDSALTEAKAREHLRKLFEDCYPFHPATLSVFHRKWSTLTHYQKTRGTLAMLAQWISWAYRAGYEKRREEPLITLGSAPLEVREFRSVVLGQLGEPNLVHAIDSDIAGDRSKAGALDADTKGPLRGIHRRVGATILFESSGGQSDQAAHQPELCFALGEPSLDTTSIETAARTLESKAFYIRRIGTDGYRFGLKPKLEKIVYDRRASLDDAEVKKETQKIVEREFTKGATIRIQKPFPKDGNDVEDIPLLNLVIVDPEETWNGAGDLKAKLREWTRNKGKSPRSFPASLIWCIRKPGRELRARIEESLAWQRVSREINDGTIGGEFESSELREVTAKLKSAEEEAREEVWASYRFVVIADPNSSDGLREIDLGAGHSSADRSLTERILGALKRNALLNESPGVGYIERRWPPAFKESGAWPLKGLRQAFLDGSLDRVVDPDAYLRQRIPQFVEQGEFGLASGDPTESGSRIWFAETLSPNEVTFEPDVYLLMAVKAKALKNRAVQTESTPEEPSSHGTTSSTEPSPPTEAQPQSETLKRKLHISGEIPSEVWNRLGTRLIPKLKSGGKLRVSIDFTLELGGSDTQQLIAEVRQTLADLGLGEALKIRPDGD